MFVPKNVKENFKIKLLLTLSILILGVLVMALGGLFGYSEPQKGLPTESAAAYTDTATANSTAKNAVAATAAEKRKVSVSSSALTTERTYSGRFALVLNGRGMSLQNTLPDYPCEVTEIAVILNGVELNRTTDFTHFKLREAGVYTIKATEISDTEHYELNPENDSFQYTINQANLQVYPSTYHKYNGQQQGPNHSTIFNNDDGEKDDVSVKCKYVCTSGNITVPDGSHPIEVGKYQIAELQLVGTQASNYTLGNAPEISGYYGLLTIEKRTLTPSFEIDSKNYDRTTNATGTFTLTGALEGDTPTATYHCAWTSKDGGTTTYNVTDITLASEWTDHYELSANRLENASNEGKCINPIALTGVSVAIHPKSYDGTTDGTGKLTFSGALEGDQVTGSAVFTWTHPNAYNTKYNVTDIALDSNWAQNYTLSTTSMSNQTFSWQGFQYGINQKILSIIWEEKTSWEYDGEPHIPTVTLSGFIGDDTGWVRTYVENGEGIDVGTYTACVDYENWSPGIGSNYALLKWDAEGHEVGIREFSITKATLTDASTAYSGTYDGSAHGITVSVSGFKKSGETLANTGTIKYGTTSGSVTATAAPTRTDAGTTTVYYQITFDNYNTITGSKTITINAKTLTITWGSMNSWVYDGQSHVRTATLGNFVTGESGTATVGGEQTNVCTNATATVTDWTVGSNTTKGNYALPSAKTSTFSITKATLTDGSTAYSGTYDGSAHGITVSVRAFKKSGETLANSGTIKYGTTSGTYNLTNAPTCTNVSDSKTVYYQITFDNYNTVTGSKTITINAKTLTITWGSTSSWVYDGASHVRTATLGNFVTGESGTATVGGAQTNACTNYIATVTDWTAGSNTTKGNYALPSAKTSTFSITKATLTDGSTAYSGTYDGSAHGITVSVSGFKKSGETLANSGTIKYGTTSGTYNLTSAPTCTNVSDSKTVYYQITFDNYNTVTGSKAITINARTLTITWGSTSSWVYDGQSHVRTATLGNFVTGQSGTATVGGAQTNAGTNYTATVTDWTAGSNTTKGNYALPSAKTSTFSITKATLTDKTEALNKVYDGYRANLVISLQGFYKNDTLALGTITYKISESDYTEEIPQLVDVQDSGTVDYRVTFENYEDIVGSLTVTISPKTLTIVWTHTSDLVYTGSEQKPTAELSGFVGSQRGKAVLGAGQTEAGENYTIGVTDWTVGGTTLKSNYELPENQITVYRINKAVMTGTVSNQRWEYDGATHKVMNAAMTLSDAEQVKHGFLLTTVNEQVQSWKFSAEQDVNWDNVTENNVLSFLNVADSKTVYYQVSAPNHETRTGSFAVAISRATLADASEGYSGVYYGNMHNIIVAVSGFKRADETLANSGHIQYRVISDEVRLTDEEYPYEENPKFIDAGTRTVGYRITFDNYNEVIGCRTVSIDNAQITGEVSDIGWVYDGKTHVVMNGRLPLSDHSQFKHGVTLFTENNQEQSWKFSAAQDVHWDSVTENNALSFLNVADGKTVYYQVSAPNHETRTGSFRVMIDRATLTDTGAGYTGLYDGGSHAITAGAGGFALGETFESAGGQIRYREGGSGEYTLTETPSYWNAGVRTVGYRMTFDNYEPLEGSQTVTIEKARLSDASIGYTGVYDGAGHGITVNVSNFRRNDETLENTGTVRYRLALSGEYALTENPVITDVSDSRTVSYKITFENYQDIEGSRDVVIRNAAIMGSVTAQSWVYDGKTHAVMNNACGLTEEEYVKNGIGLTVVNNQIQTWKFSAEPDVDWDSVTADNRLLFENVADGKVVYYRVTAPNHSAAYGSFKVTIGRATLTDECEGYTGDYDGEAHRIAVKVSGFVNDDQTLEGVGEIRYRTTRKGEYLLTENPAGTDVADSKTVYYWMTFDNYFDVIGEQDLTIDKIILTPIPTVQSKYYDGTTRGTGSIALTGAIVAGEEPTATGLFTWASEATGTTLYRVTDIALLGSWSANYELSATELYDQMNDGALILEKFVTSITVTLDESKKIIDMKTKADDLKPYLTVMAHNSDSSNFLLKDNEYGVQFVGEMKAGSVITLKITYQASLTRRRTVSNTDSSQFDVEIEMLLELVLVKASVTIDASAMSEYVFDDDKSVQEITGAVLTYNGAAITDTDVKLEYANNTFEEIPKDGKILVFVSFAGDDVYEATSMTVMVTITDNVIGVPVWAMSLEIVLTAISVIVAVTLLVILIIKKRQSKQIAAEFDSHDDTD